MERIILGLAGIVVGTLVAGFGTRAFYLLLPLWGAVSGFLLGAETVSELLGEGLLTTALGWAVGIGLGLLFGILAGLWYYAAVVILAASVGYGAGSGLLIALGLEPGLVTALAGAGVAAVIAVGAILVDAPTILIAVLTGFGGAALGIAGAWLLVGQITVADLDSRGPLGALREQPLALLAWAGLGALATGYQLLEARRGGASPMAGITA